MIGIVTSSLSIVLFVRDDFSPLTTRRLLLSTAVVDVLFLLGSTLYLQPLSFCSRQCNLFKFFYSMQYIVPNGLLVNLLEMERNWLVVLICIERFIITCFPFKARIWLSVRNTNAAIAACSVFSVLVRTPFLAYIVLEGLGSAHTDAVTTLKLIHSSTDAIIGTLIPLVVLIICSCRMRRAIRDSDRLRHRHRPLSGTALREKVTRVLLIVIVTFAIFMLPLVPLNLLAFNFFPSTSTCGVLVANEILSPLAVFGSLLNSTANFFVYVAYWEKYRRFLVHLLRGGKQTFESRIVKGSISAASEFSHQQ